MLINFLSDIHHMAKHTSLFIRTTGVSLSGLSPQLSNSTDQDLNYLTVSSVSLFIGTVYTCALSAARVHTTEGGFVTTLSLCCYAWFYYKHVTPITVERLHTEIYFLKFKSCILCINCSRCTHGCTYSLFPKIKITINTFVLLFVLRNADQSSAEHTTRLIVG